MALERYASICSYRALSYRIGLRRYTRRAADVVRRLYEGAGATRGKAVSRRKSYCFSPALIITVVFLSQGCSETSDIAAGPAPDFTVELFQGGRFQLSEHKGTPVVINFFASWCRACGEETPIIEEAAREYGPEKVAFLGIAVDDTEKKAQAFMQEIGLTIPAGLDRTGEIKDAYGLYGMPTTFFIDKHGMVSYHHPGVVSAPLLKHELDKLL